MNSLANSLMDFFPAKIRLRGESYFRDGMVELEPPHTPGLITARVQGSEDQPYDVRIDTTGDEPELSCTCPYAAEWGDYCKHIWAALRAVEADATGAPAARAVTATALAVTPHSLRAMDPLVKEPATLRPRPDRGAAASISDMVGRIRRPAARAARTAPWRELLADLDDAVDGADLARPTGPIAPPWYVLDVDRARATGRVCLLTCRRAVRKDGSPGALRSQPVGSQVALSFADPADRLVVGLLAGTANGWYGYGVGGAREEWSVDAETLRMMLPSLTATGRFVYRMSPIDEPRPLQRDDGPPWQAVLALTPGAARGFEMGMRLARGEERRDVHDAAILIHGAPGLCLIDGALADLETFGCPVEILREYGESPVNVPARDVRRVVDELSLLASPPRLELPAEHALSVAADILPTGQVELSVEDRHVLAQVSYRYGDVVVPGVRRGGVVIDAAGKRQILRNAAAEQALVRQLPELGFEEDRWREAVVAPVARLTAIVRALSERGWAVLADGRLFRRAGEIDISVTSGVDWFDVDAKVDFEGAVVALPELLEALRGGQQYVRLGDGTLGMLPEDWLARHGLLLDLGRAEGEHLRFSRTQALLLDALLEEHSKVRVDAGFAEMRTKLRSFDGIKPVAPTANFVGALRGYQEHGLGWMTFLDEFGWGGCLADDMGLGKTVQVLAWLASRRSRMTDPAARIDADAPPPKSKVQNPKSDMARLPSLVIAPKSVVFNWIDEARRFTPELRVHAYHGTGRRHALPHFNEYDLVVTTYHTARIDIADFAKREFDYVILDEAQMVKNAKAQVAKAVKLLRARRRLVLTGTPVENHLGDLWSIFDFLNPGMLGAVSAFREAFNTGDVPAERIDTLRRAVRPFLLRRTKEAVAPELPSKTEETLLCEMTAAQSKKYAELRDFYRAAVLGKVDQIGLARSKIHVLEALLRLRQAACHPALLDAQVAAEEAGKIEALMPLLTEVIEGGHKALIFSQFTSFLAILRGLLEKAKTTYEYLDGQTHDRRQRVDRFQSDTDCRLFLISLKAGGLGLNLTAADYVFILDPWWNPAAEAQAIDRTHRIGQDKKVIAYRLIAKGTVEEKILELQAKKRDLAASIITQANSLISELTRADLEVLLS